MARIQRVGRYTLYEWLARFDEHRRSDLHAATTSRTPRAAAGSCGTGSSPGSAS